MQPAGLNKTEAKVWEWLLESEGYDESEITRDNHRQIPDFTVGGEPYEVQRPYSNIKLLVTERQAAEYDRIDPVIVVMHEDDDEPRETFRWSEREDANYYAHVYSQGRRISCTVDKETKRRWDQMKAAINPDLDDGEVIEYILDIYDSHPSFFIDEYR